MYTYVVLHQMTGHMVEMLQLTDAGRLHLTLHIPVFSIPNVTHLRTVVATRQRLGAGQTAASVGREMDEIRGLFQQATRLRMMLAEHRKSLVKVTCCQRRERTECFNRIKFTKLDI